MRCWASRAASLHGRAPRAAVAGPAPCPLIVGAPGAGSSGRRRRLGRSRRRAEKPRRQRPMCLWDVSGQRCAGGFTVVDTSALCRSGLTGLKPLRRRRINWRRTARDTTAHDTRYTTHCTTAQRHTTHSTRHNGTRHTAQRHTVQRHNGTTAHCTTAQRHKAGRHTARDTRHNGTTTHCSTAQ